MRGMGKGSRHPGIERYDGPEGTRWIAHAAKRVAGTRKTWQGTFATERQALTARRDWITTFDKRLDIVRTRKTVGDALATWLATHLPGKAATTRASYTAIVKNHLAHSTLADMQLYDLSTAAIQEWYNSLTVGARTKEMIHLRLCQALDLAVKHRLLVRNFARECTIERSVPRRGIALDSEQLDRFLYFAAENFYHPFWHLALATGLRRAELLGLRWCDVDAGHTMLLIRHTNVFIGVPNLEERTKTPSSKRFVKLDASTMAMLTTHKAAQSRRRELAGDAWEHFDLVFCSAIGRPLRAPNIHRSYKALLEQARLPADVTIHDMRHTHLSALIDRGVPIATVAERGGYRNPATLLAVYIHAYAAGHEAAADAAGDLIFGTPKISGKEMTSI